MGWLRDRRVWAVLFALAVVVQLIALYLPNPPSGGGFPGADKVVHAAIFLAPALLGVVAGLRLDVLASLLIVHAVVSEVVQHVALPGRGGDPWDAVADIVGVAIGLAIGSALLLRIRGDRPAGPASGGAPRGSGGRQRLP
ncbi:MAG: VanZ family protein [Actinomycetota bacterium]